MDIYRLKLTLRHIRPPIWRRLEVPSHLTLLQLHRVFQRAMGWSDEHLHEFRRGDVTYGRSDREMGLYRESEGRVLLEDVLTAPRQKMAYVYDFGDHWVHDVLLERVTAADASLRYPRVVAGARACPPEDVGGAPGYAHFVEVIANENHPEYRDMLDWAGGHTDPEAFELAATDTAVQRAVRVRAERRGEGDF